MHLDINAGDKKNLLKEEMKHHFRLGGTEILVIDMFLYFHFKFS